MIALHTGMVVGAHAILISEQSVCLEQIRDWVQMIRDHGPTPVTVVAEEFVLEGAFEPHSPSLRCHGVPSG